MILVLLILNSGISADLRGPRPKNLTEPDGSGFKILEVDIFSIFDDLANNIRNNYISRPDNSTNDPIIKNIVYVQSEDNNENSNINIRGTNNPKTVPEIKCCNNSVLLILTIISVALNIINIFILTFVQKPIVRYRIPPENLLCEERSMTQCSSQSRAI